MTFQGRASSPLNEIFKKNFEFSDSISDRYIFVSHGLSASINIPTHNAGNTLDNVLLENVNQFDDFMVIKDLFLSNHYPFLFNCLISSSSSKSNPLASYILLIQQRRFRHSLILGFISLSQIFLRLQRLTLSIPT